MPAVPDVAPNSSPAPRVKRRRWYLAAFLSFICPGLGQLYNTQLRRALAIWIVLALGVAVAILLSHFTATSFATFLAIIGIFAAVVGLQLFTAVDAGVGAWRLRMAELRPYNRAWVYILVFLLSYAANSTFSLYKGTATYSIPAGSMHPTVLIGDYLIADKGYFGRHAPQRGDLAIFKLPTDNRTDYIKRVIGLPGDTIQMIAGRLHINGQAVDRSRIADHVEQRGAMAVRMVQYVESLPDGSRYLIREERGDNGALDNTAAYLVPADHYFVLGDNRDNSQDSRVLSEVGFIPRVNFRDRPAFVIWSREKSRIGLHVE